MKIIHTGRPEIEKPSLAEIRLLAESGDTEGALAGLTPHLEGKRPDPEAINLAAILHEGQGRIGRAVELYGRAVKQCPDDPRFNFKLGKNLVKIAEHEAALKCLQKAVWLHPAMAVARSHIGLAREGMGDFQGAFDEHLRALEMDPSLEVSRRGLASLLGGRKLKLKPSPLLRKALENIFASEKLDLAPVSRIAAAQLRRDHGLFNSPPAGVWQPTEAVVSDRLFLAFLMKAVNEDPLMEAFLTAGRAWFLKAFVEKGLRNDHMEFLAALAGQCFINSYVFFEAVPEEKLIGLFWKKAGEKPPGVPADYIALAVCALYRPLYKLPIAADLAEWPLEAWPMAFRALIRATLLEPCAEKAYQRRIPELSAINDETSLKVKSQYEESPYPRWVNLPFFRPRGFLSDMAALGADVGKLPRFEALNSLVAGCGTGRGALGLAQSYPGLAITALDLSKASLAYAMRKALEMGRYDIKFVQGDILEAGLLGQGFHYIDCVGVLHHMAYPLAGWRELAALLPPGGIMKVALYSKAARREISAVREQIAERGIGATPKEIRDFRRLMMMEQDADTLADLFGFRDFYNLDECRDLLFHVMEHCFDLPGLKDALKDVGLEFVNFLGLSPAVQQSFKNETGGELNDLDAWRVYEEKYPQFFKGMYTFICQKP